MIGHLLNRKLSVWRPETATDEGGGLEVTHIEQGEVPAMVSQPTAEERLAGQRWGSEHSHNVYMLPGADVARGDELRGGGQVFRVLATVEPSRSAYTKAPCELRQSEGS